jgi:hypothetical protein
MKPIFELFWVKEMRPLKIVSMVIEAGILLTRQPLNFLWK